MLKIFFKQWYGTSKWTPSIKILSSKGWGDEAFTGNNRTYQATINIFIRQATSIMMIRSNTHLVRSRWDTSILTQSLCENKDFDWVTGTSSTFSRVYGNNYDDDDDYFPWTEYSLQDRTLLIWHTTHPTLLPYE